MKKLKNINQIKLTSISKNEKHKNIIKKKKNKLKEKYKFEEKPQWKEKEEKFLLIHTKIKIHITM